MNSHGESLWCTAQARYGPLIRVQGLQHPPPPLPCSARRQGDEVICSSPTRPVRSTGAFINFLLYAQVAQLDNDGYRNLLIAKAGGKDPFPGKSEMQDFSKVSTVNFNNAIFDIKSLEPLMAQLGLNPKTVRLSVL